MDITPINSDFTQSIERINSVKNDLEKKSFTSFLSDAFTDAIEAEKQVEQTNIDLLTGENDSIHAAMIDAEKAEITLSLAMQVRNKVVDAYNEIMRMQL